MTKDAKLVAVRVPKSVARSVRMRLRRLGEQLAWSTVDPVEDVPRLIASFAGIAHKISLGVRKEIVQEIRDRISELKSSELLADLYAAAELEDLVDDLEAPIRKEEEAPCDR